MSHSEHDLSASESSPDPRSTRNGFSRGIFHGLDSHVSTARTGWSRFIATCKSTISKVLTYLQHFDWRSNGQLVHSLFTHTDKATPYARSSPPTYCHSNCPDRDINQTPVRQ